MARHSGYGENMAGKDIADLVISNMKSIDWKNTDGSMFKDKAMGAVAKGIRTYINDNWSITANTIGTLTPPPPAPPTPYSGSVKINMTVPPDAPLKANFMSMVQGTVPMAAMISFFNAINMWLLTFPPIMITQGPPLSPVAGVGKVLFPTFAAMGVACAGEMAGAKPTDMRKAWELVGKHIYNGIAANVIAPIPTTGMLPPAAYVGVTTAILKF